MKNIFLVPTNGPTKVIQCTDTIDILKEIWKHPLGNIGRYLYITSDDRPSNGDYCIHPISLNISEHHEKDNNLNTWEKIILTTNIDLINRDKARSIGDDFLFLFAKNPNCSYVEISTEAMFKGYITFPEDINKSPFYGNLKHRISIPEELDTFNQLKLDKKYPRELFELDKDVKKEQLEETYSKEDLILFYTFIKEKCDIINTSGYVETHIKMFLDYRKKNLNNLK